jgi:hypothetical protein
VTKLPSKRFCNGVRTMSNEKLLRVYTEYSTKMDALEEERMRCWNRFMEINEIQDVLGGERQMLSIEVHMNRKLKVS